jgi:hypothetical protein
MENQNINLEQLITNPIFKTFYAIGLIDEIALRNYIIKSEYSKLRRTQSQLSAIFDLSEKYHLSYDAVHTILFRKRKTKSFHLPLFN